MDRTPIDQIKQSLFLISLTFLAILILFICSFITWDFPFINFLLLYLFSLFLPTYGLLVFMKNIRMTSPRWYLGIPFLIGMILNTFVRDVFFMLPKSTIENGFWAFFYGNSFISNFPILVKWHIIVPVTYGEGYDMNFTALNLISIFFYLTVVLFCFSVPKGKRKKMLLPICLSLVAVLSRAINFISQSMIADVNALSFGLTYIFSIESFFYVYSITVLLLGLSFIRAGITYDK